MSDTTIVYLVLPNTAKDESEASDLMNMAYSSCKEVLKNVNWVKESDLDKLTLNKSTYLTFDDVGEKDFSKYLHQKAHVLGPLALNVCLMECKPIPRLEYPIQNVSMYNCVVTCSQLPKPQKMEIQKKVQLMGGVYMASFTLNVTHLICNGTKSEKYIRSVERGVTVLLPSWIDYLFEVSKTKNVVADDPEIIAKHKCPPFQNLVISSTGVKGLHKQQELSNLITTYGGKFTTKLRLATTDILICCGSNLTSSEKFKRARQCKNVSCVSIDWVYDSVAKGYALLPDAYRIATSTSTPQKECENIDPNFSTVSAIDPFSSLRTINSTSMADESTVSKSGAKRKSEEMLENLDAKKAKSAGNFLDGCSVFLAGFSPQKKEKLNKIINNSGAIRYDNFSKRVSHVIVGDRNCTEVKSIQNSGFSCYLVKSEWLIESVNQKMPANEYDFFIHKENSENRSEISDVNSTLSKNTLSLLKQDGTLTKTRSRSPEMQPDKEDNLTQQYLQVADQDEDSLALLLKDQEIPTKNPTDDFVLNTRSKNVDINESLEFRPGNTSTQVSTIEVKSLTIFQSLKFFIGEFDESVTKAIFETVVQCQGTVVTCPQDVCDYAILPICSNEPPKEMVNATNIVNELWLFDCQDNEILCRDIQYYHKTIKLPDSSPLEECVITLSGYTEPEKTFLSYVIDALGGTYQEQLSKRTNLDEDLKAATHLVFKEGTKKKKFQAALKWQLPIVDKDWLMDCLRYGERMPEDSYLVGETSRNMSEISNANTTAPSIDKDPTPMEAQQIRDTPEKVQNLIRPVTEATPIRQLIALNRSPCSQVTPLNKILEDARKNKVLSASPSTPQAHFPWNIKTPETPLGQIITPNPSPGLRKELQRYLNSFPDFVQPKRRMSTPLSQIRKRLADKVLGRGEYAQDQSCSQVTQDPSETSNHLETDVNDKPLKNSSIHQKMQDLQQRVMMTNVTSSGNKRTSKLFVPDLNKVENKPIDVQSQACTLAWDYGEERSQKPAKKVFMFTGVTDIERDQLTERIKELGSTVTDSQTFDASATHLLCAMPRGNLKILACMASGKWILHMSYIEKCFKAGRFLNEEEFEFGNPKAKANSFGAIQSSCSLWRKEITRRGYGAFNDMRAIIVAEKREPLVKVIEAGGGVIVNVTPPFHDTVHATHCFFESKVVKDVSPYLPLHIQGVKCLNTLYINDFLFRNKKDDGEYILPYFITHSQKS